MQKAVYLENKFRKDRILDMDIDTTYYERCIQALSKAYTMLMRTDPETIDYDM